MTASLCLGNPLMHLLLLAHELLQYVQSHLLLSKQQIHVPECETYILPNISERQYLIMHAMQPPKCMTNVNLWTCNNSAHVGLFKLYLALQQRAHEKSEKRDLILYSGKFLHGAKFHVFHGQIDYLPTMYYNASCYIISTIYFLMILIATSQVVLHQSGIISHNEK